MYQDTLFHEDFREALKHVINAMGGPKKVGSEINPALTPDRARSWLSNCLDENRAEKLDLEQVVMILAMARKAGVHSAFAFLAGECGYEAPRTVEPEDERDALMRQFIKATETQAQIARRLEKVSQRT